MSGILWLGDPAACDTGLVGAKAANLSTWFAHHAVPDGFVITALPADPAALVDDLRERIALAYAELGRRSGVADPAVAVRSSALDEDSIGASFAGKHDTFLNMRGTDAVLDATARCLDSANSAEAMAYRGQHGIGVDTIRIAVLIQLLVPADVAAVVFSHNPMNGSEYEVMINSNWGLGESVVGGTATPDSFIVDKESGDVLQSMIARKLHCTIRTEDGTRDAEVAEELQTKPSLTDAQIAEMTRMAIALEEASGYPVDIECAIADGRLYLLQCRPITTL